MMIVLVMKFLKTVVLVCILTGPAPKFLGIRDESYGISDIILMPDPLTKETRLKCKFHYN